MQENTVRPEALPNNARFYALSQSSRTAETQEWTTLSEYVGGQNAKTMLINGVYKPEQCHAKVYKRIRSPTLHVLYGADGSGKRALVRAFCMEYGVNLIEVTEHRLVPFKVQADDVARIYDQAHAARPCLVLFHHCDSSVLEANESTEHALLAHLRDAESERRLWTVFSLVSHARYLSPRYAPLTRAREWLRPLSYTPTNEPPKDRFEERRTLFRQMLNARLYGRDVLRDAVLSDVEFQRLVTVAHHTTPRQMASYLDRVWLSVLDRVPLHDFASASAEELTPQWVDFESALSHPGGADSIVDEEPDLKTTQPYE